MSQTVETLEDLPPQKDGVLVVGINPAPASVRVGHYYQGTLGRRLWSRLIGLGLLDQGMAGWEDDALVARGHGLSDIVKRPTGSAAELSNTELKVGAEILREKIRRWHPGIILFAFAETARHLVGMAIPPGPGPSVEGIPTFRLTGPYASRADAEQNDEKFRELLVSPSTGARPGQGVSQENGLVRSSQQAGAMPEGNTSSPHGLPFSQPVTAVDKDAGRIRLPKRANPSSPHPAATSKSSSGVFPSRAPTTRVPLPTVNVPLCFESEEARSPP